MATRPRGGAGRTARACFLRAADSRTPTPTHDVDSKTRCQTTSGSFVNDCKACGQLLSQENGSRFACAKPVLHSPARQLNSVCTTLQFDPRCTLNVTCTQPPGPDDSDFLKQFCGDHHLLEKRRQDMQRSDFGERDERRRV